MANKICTEKLPNKVMWKRRRRRHLSWIKHQIKKSTEIKLNIFFFSDLLHSCILIGAFMICFFPICSLFFCLIWLQCDCIWLRSKHLLGDVGRNNWRNVSIFSICNKSRAHKTKESSVYSISFRVLSASLCTMYMFDLVSFLRTGDKDGNM